MIRFKQFSKIMMKKCHLFLTLVLAISMVVFSPDISAQGAEGTEISFRLLCFEHRENVTSVLAPLDNGKTLEIPLYTSDFSGVFKAKFKGGKASLYVQETTPDGAKQQKLVAEGKLAKSVRQAFVLIPTDSKTGPIYRIVAFEDGEETFPMGATRVINLAPFPIRLNLAGMNMPPIKPGGLGMYPEVKKVDEWNMYTARIQFGVAEGQWVDVATQSWKASKRKRDWVIARFDPATKQPAIRQYQDVPPWRKTVLAAPAGVSP